MENADSERLLNLIGSVLAKDAAYPLDKTLLYAEVASNTAEISVFKDIGNQIVYRPLDHDLFDLLLDLWEAHEPGKAWIAIEYLIRRDRFEVSYIYSDDPGWNDDLDYREKVVARYFGDKPIVYPPMPTGDQTFKL
ncbi:MAG: hypothetical protein ACRYG4_25050 [Janthinobacterium lividum]